MAGVVRLEWQRDSRGYEIVPVERRRRTGATIAEGVDPDEAGDPSHAWDTPDAWNYAIRGKGGAPKHFVLEGVGHGVSLALANTAFTPEGVLEFAGKWGLPVGRRLLDAQEPPELYWIYRAISHVRALLALVERRAWPALERALHGTKPHESGLAQSKLQFRRLPGDSTPRVFIEPSGLVGFCQFEAMQMVGDAELRRCLNCGAFILARVRGRRGPQQMHCSVNCRVAAHRRAHR
jgi:hypothetical protein